MTCYRLSLVGIPTPSQRTTHILQTKPKAESRLGCQVTTVIAGLGVGLDEAELKKAGLLLRRQDRPAGLQYVVDLVSNGD